MDTDTDLVPTSDMDTHHQLHTPPLVLDSHADSADDDDGDHKDTPERDNNHRDAKIMDTQKADEHKDTPEASDMCKDGKDETLDNQKGK